MSDNDFHFKICKKIYDNCIGLNLQKIYPNLFSICDKRLNKAPDTKSKFLDTGIYLYSIQCFIRNALDIHHPYSRSFKQRRVEVRKQVMEQGINALYMANKSEEDLNKYLEQFNSMDTDILDKNCEEMYNAMYRIPGDTGTENVADDEVNPTFIIQASRIPHELLHETGTMMTFHLPVTQCKSLIIEMVKYEMNAHSYPDMALDVSMVYDPTTVSNKNAQGEMTDHVVPLYKLYATVDFTTDEEDEDENEEDEDENEEDEDEKNTKPVDLV